MSLKFRTIADPGIANKERVILDVLSNVDCGRYALNTARKEGGLYIPNNRRFFWFPDRQVKKGDVLVVYSKAGTNSQRQEASGETFHFFYWSFDITLFNDAAETAVLLELATWSFCERGPNAAPKIARL